MKKLIFLFALTILFIGCEEIYLLSSRDPLEEELLVIENLTYDEDGIVFNITNDIDTTYHSSEGTMWLIDSVKLVRFHIPWSGKFEGDYCLTFEYGQKANWRYKYKSYPLRIICHIGNDSVFGQAVSYTVIHPEDYDLIDDTIKVNLSVFRESDWKWTK